PFICVPPLRGRFATVVVGGTRRPRSSSRSRPRRAPPGARTPAEMNPRSRRRGLVVVRDAAPMGSGMELPQLTPSMVATLGVCIGALLLFLWNRWRFEVIGLITVAALFILGILPLEDALSGFASEATLAVAGV